MVIHDKDPWFADIVNFLASKVIHSELNPQARKRFIATTRFYFWDEPYLFKRGPDQVIRRCVPENEQGEILRFCHERECGGDYSGKKTMM